MKKKYLIKKTLHPIDIDADWNKPAWRDVRSVEIELSHWPVQTEHVPKTFVKLQYDAEHLYVIFRVQDRYVRAAATDIHGEVWKDSCVEFFFAPDLKNPDSYFNLETNCCGVLLAQQHTGPRTNSRFLDVEDCRQIRIASSVLGPLEQEITDPVTWTLEYALPTEILTRYADVEKPADGVIWRGNFYKCADDSSRPHWMTWSPIPLETPDFHRPEYFGQLQFA